MSECPICFEKCSDEVILACVHKLCLQCTKKLYIQDHFFKCPLCRKSQNNLLLIKVNGKLFTEVVKLNTCVKWETDWDGWSTERRQYVRRSPAPVSENMTR